jgi:cytochrome c-type biogenesis protein CcmH/NrfG
MRTKSAGGTSGSIAQTLVVAGAAFLLVVCVGAATSYVGDSPEANGSRDTMSLSPSKSEMARLNDYARSTEAAESAATPADKLLPDVSTMIERLAARLESKPEDIGGWRMLGWSYFNTARYKEAAIAYGRAVELDPSSPELKLSYGEAKAKASKSDKVDTTSSLQTKAVRKSDEDLSVATSQAIPPHERDSEVRSMVDRLTHRLESSPRDVEGWTLLMRSRVVLGENAVATTAFQKALEVFKDDSGASEKISAAAMELGLKTE